MTRENFIKRIEELDFEIKVSQNKEKEFKKLIIQCRTEIMESSLEKDRIVEELRRMDAEYPPPRPLTPEQLDLIRFKEALPELLKKL